jgi:alpha-amylase
LGNKEINGENLFAEGEKVHDFYSGKTAIVTNGKITINTPYSIVLIEKQ